MPALSCLPSPLPGTLSTWRGILSSHYFRLGSASRRMRFLSPVPDQAIARIAARAHPDLVLGFREDGEIRGVLEIFRQADGHAEIGLSVEDAYQGRGHGRELLLAGLRHARAMGVETADLYYTEANRSIDRLVRSAGARIRQTGPELLAEIDLKDFPDA